MFDYRRGWWHGRYVIAQADRDQVDDAETARRRDAASAGRPARWLAGFDAGVRSIDRTKLSWNVKRRALQPPSPDDSFQVRLQRGNNRFARADIRFTNGQWAFVIGLLSIAIIVGTALTGFRLGYLVIWPVTVLWAALGCWYLPRRTTAAELAAQQAWASPRYEGLQPAVRRSALWTMLTLANLVGGIAALLLLSRLLT